MRVLLALLAFLALMVLSVAGFRGMTSSRLPLELIPDMARQPKIRPQTRSDFFEDGFASRLPVRGTVARGMPALNQPSITGRVPGTTNFVEVNPLAVTVQLVARGRDRFQINCSPCHGAQGVGKGITTRLGLTAIANLHDPRVVRMPDGEIFNTIGRGKNLMQGYGAVLDPADRWAVVGFLRALQLSHLGLVEDVPAEQQLAFKERENELHANSSSD